MPMCSPAPSRAGECREGDLRSHAPADGSRLHVTSALLGAGTTYSQRCSRVCRPRRPASATPSRCSQALGGGLVESKGTGREMNCVRLACSWARAALAAGSAVGPAGHGPEAPPDAGYAPAPLVEISASAPVHGGGCARPVSGRDNPFEWWGTVRIAGAQRAGKSIRRLHPRRQHWFGAQELVHAQRGCFFPAVSANPMTQAVKIAGNLTVDKCSRRRETARTSCHRWTEPGHRSSHPPFLL